MRRAAGKRLDLAAAAKAMAEWNARGDRVVLAVGVFDVLQVGDVRYLEGAREQGDRLVVAVNGDRATAKLEGAGRPVLPATERSLLVASLRAVDAVVVFEEDTADAVFERLRPDVHARAAGDRVDSVPERATAGAGDVRTVITGDPKACSSRDLIERVRERTQGGG